MNNTTVETYNSTDDWSTDESTISAWTTVSSTTKPVSTTPAPCYPWSNPICDPWILGTWYFVRYGGYLAYAVGIPGSVLTLIILARMKPFNSSSVWLSAICLIDLASLFIRLVFGVILHQVEETYWVTWNCQFFHIVTYSLEFSSYFYLVGLTVERFIAVWFPLKMSQWCTVRRAVIVCVLIVALCVAQNMHYVHTMRLGVWGSCVVRKKYRPVFQTLYFEKIQTTLNYLLPIVTLAVLNILIVVRLRSAQAIQKQMSETQNKEKLRQQKQINRMLVAASAGFFLCCFPQMIYNYSHNQWAPSFPRDLVVERAWVICENTFAVLRTYNHALNFFFYVIAARKFRAQLIKLVTCHRVNLEEGRSKSVSTSKSSVTKVTDVKISMVATG